MDCPTFRAGFLLKREESLIAGQLPDAAGHSKSVSARPPFRCPDLLSVTSSIQSESADLQSIVMRYIEGRLLLLFISYCDIHNPSFAGWLC